jgi:hypothetical protein
MRTPTQPTTTSRREILRTSAAIAVVLVLLIPLAGLHADGEPAALATIAQRERAVLEAATADFGRLNGNSPMHYWVQGTTSTGLNSVTAFIT